MKKGICKFIVVLFFDCFVGGIFAILQIANKQATQTVLAVIGTFCIGWLVVKIVDWLFEEKKEAAGNE